MRRKVSGQIMVTIKVISALSSILKKFPSWIEDESSDFVHLKIPHWAYDELQRIVNLKTWSVEEKPHADD